MHSYGTSGFLNNGYQPWTNSASMAYVPPPPIPEGQSNSPPASHQVPPSPTTRATQPTILFPDNSPTRAYSIHTVPLAEIPSHSHGQTPLAFTDDLGPSQAAPPSATSLYNAQNDNADDFTPGANVAHLPLSNDPLHPAANPATSSPFSPQLHPSLNPVAPLYNAPHPQTGQCITKR